MELRQSLFWDTNVKNFDLEKHARYIIERVADFGLDSEVRWVLDSYDKQLIRDTITTSRSVRPRTKALWILLAK